MYENITFEVIMERILNRIPNTLDKREGSIIYDAIAPVAIDLALAYIELDTVLKESFADTAGREYLIKRAKERGITPNPATYAIARGIFTPSSLELTIGDRFSCGDLIYVITEKNSNGNYKLKCETIGIKGNENLGQLIPVNYIEGLETANLTEILIPAEDEEDTEDLRDRYFESFQSQAFGGNIADYKEKTKKIDGVGGVKVYPIWNGGGTVKLVIISSLFLSPSIELIDTVQTAIDPLVNQGQGVGLAPIGHTVTVVGVDELIINIQSTITFAPGYDIDSAITSLRSVVDEYFNDLRKNWDSEEQIIVRISQIESKFLTCAEVIDVQDTTINNSSLNLILGANEIPIRGTINGK